MPKTAAGEGYTVRVGSKKVLKATLLEQELEAAKKQHAELLQQNELLRAKEAMHMQLLESCEVGLRVQGEAAAARLTPSASTAHSASLLQAALLDMQALELKQVLMPASDHPPPAPTAPAQQGPAGAAGAIRQQDSPLSTPGHKSTAASSSSHSSGGGSIFSGLGTPSEDGCDSSTNRTKQLVGSLTAADVLQFQGLTLEEVGDRFRACISRLALARQASRAKQAASLDLGSTVEDFGRLCVLSLVSDELRHCRIVGLNLESMQHEAPPEGLWAEVVEKAHLQPQQREHISRAFRSCSQQQSQLLQRQREVLQQLQTVFAAKGPLSGSLATSAAADGAAAGAGASAEASAAGPAQSRPVVAAAYTDTGATHSPAGGSSRAAQATPGASPLVAAATAPAEAPLSPQDLQRLAHTYMQQGPDGASSSGSHGWLATAGVLNLDDAERAEQLLQELSKVSRALKQHARRLSTMIINLLTAEQHADAILTAYPFILNVPAVCACIAAAEP